MGIKKKEILIGRKILIEIFDFYISIGFIKTWISGGMAGICFWIIMFPIDAIKSRIQVFKPNLSFSKYTFEIIKNEGREIFSSLSIIIIKNRFYKSVCWFISNSYSYIPCNWCIIYNI